MACYEELNLNKVLSSWSSYIFQSTSEPHTLDPEQVQFSFDLTGVKFKDSPPTFKQEAPDQCPSPKEKILSTNGFENDRDDVQRYPLKYSGETVSIAMVTLDRAMIYDKKTRMNLWELPDEVQAAGFGKELVVTGLNSPQELRYSKPHSVDESVEIPPHTSSRAEVVAKERVQEYHFEVKTKMKGIVHCSATSCETGDLVRSLDGNIVQILENYAVDISGSLVKGLTVNDGKAVFVSQGKCQFTFCDEAKVKLVRLQCLK